MISVAMETVDMEDNLNTTFRSIDESVGSQAWSAELEALEREGEHLERALQVVRQSFQRLVKEHALISEVGRVISSSLDIEEVYERFAEEVQKLLPFDRIGISIVDQENGTFINQYVVGVQTKGRERGDVVPLEGTTTNEAVRSRSGVIIQGDLEDMRAKYPNLVSGGLRSFIVVPLMYQNKVVGVLSLRSREYNAYSEEHLALLMRVATQITPAVVNAELFADVSRLATFPLHNPNPVVETDLDGNLTYYNRVAHDRFPGHQHS